MENAIDLEKSSIWFGSQLAKTFYKYATPVVPGHSLEEIGRWFCFTYSIKAYLVSNIELQYGVKVSNLLKRVWTFKFLLSKVYFQERSYSYNFV